MNSAIIGVGSNIDAHANIEKAGGVISRDQELKEISAFVTTRHVNTSTRMPEYSNEQPDFLNGAFAIETELDMKGLKSYLKGVERSLGRPLPQKSPSIATAGETPAGRSGARTIDLDIIVFNGLVVSGDFKLYAFVRDAVLELAPELKTPKA